MPTTKSPLRSLKTLKPSSTTFQNKSASSYCRMGRNRHGALGGNGQDTYLHSIRGVVGDNFHYCDSWNCFSRTSTYPGVAARDECAPIGALRAASAVMMSFRAAPAFSAVT